MIIVTGGDGFIGSNLIAGLIRRGYYEWPTECVSIDTKLVTLDKMNEFLMKHAEEIRCVFHLGAITDTTEMNINKFDEYNVNSSMFIWNLCTNYNIPLIYASSAATYGDGSLGFDDTKDINKLQPLNPYGWSKQQFDVWAEKQEKHPPFWCGLKFFNVYGYGEENKGKMASVVYHAYNQIKETSGIKLFKSHNSGYDDGEQVRDFIYVDDVVDVCVWMYENRPESGIYNVGTGDGRSFNDLARAVFMEFHKDPKIEYIPTPLKIRDKYQYFTEAKVNKLRMAGYAREFTILEDGVKKYVQKLSTKKI